MNSLNDPIEKVSSLIKNSVTLKLVTITILMLLLLIPAVLIEEIIFEREQLNQEVVDEVSFKWGHKQQINGPILTIPVIYEYEEEEKKTIYTRYWHLLPEDLKIDGEVIPKKLNRGIYEVVVYKSRVDVSGSFYLSQKPDPQDLKEIRYNEAFLTIGITDPRGIKSQIDLNWNGDNLLIDPGSRLSELIYSGVTAQIQNLRENLNQKLTFDFALDLNGSQNISFVPLGKITDVQLRSSWASPSFNGSFLPDSREVNETGFTASWSILQLNRNYPQSWIGNSHNEPMKNSSFGVDLILPLDDYQKSMRSVKYAVMTIALTFLIFFLVEIRNKKKIHPFQYALVGLALCLFYILLVSISEHTDFNLAYIVSAAGTILMISLYSLSVFRRFDQSLILIAALVGIYGFLFFTLQLADYALLMGSIGLSIILALTMYFTRNINWYNLNIETE